MKFKILFVFLIPFSLVACSQSQEKDMKNTTQFEISKTEKEWKAQLSPEAYDVLREAGTEPAFTGSLLDNKQKGLYICAACNNSLFDSNTKFHSGTGWPSFYTSIGDSHVLERVDRSYGWSRTEVVCGRCGSHLGHVFQDGPEPTGLRYCINSVSLKFEPD